MQESEFLKRVCARAQSLGWRYYHPTRAVYRGRYWLTPHIGQSGFPDLVLVRGHRLIFAELKGNCGRLKPAQDEWLSALRACGVEVYLWRPRDWPTIEQILE